MTKKETPGMKIKISDDVLKGCYANTLVVTHSNEEFVLDFILSLPPQGVINSRVITSPRHLKRFIEALRQNLARYEERHGPVAAAPDPAGRKPGGVH